MRRLDAYINPTLARVAIGAIRARQVQLVAAEAAGDTEAVKQHTASIAQWERQLFSLERNPKRPVQSAAE